jgi:GMP synthase (glutamine-hydrolysing)
MGVPLLGICYGHQLIAANFGGEVGAGSQEEGYITARIIEECPIFEGLGGKMNVFMKHTDYVVKPPEGFLIVADSPKNRFAAYWSPALRVFGVQFHPEVGGDGFRVLDNFLKL